MKEFTYRLKTGISRSREFERKGLATHAINVGTKCGHDCCYCSSPSLVRCHESFRNVGESPFAPGFSIVDPETPALVARDVHKLNAGHVVMISTISDAWAPESQKLQLGERCTEIVLKNSPATVRILTKNAAVRRVFRIVGQCPERVRLSLSITAPHSREDLIRVLEPNASPISERLEVLKEAHCRGIQTYGMLCPCLPSIADTPEALDEMFSSVLARGAQDIWVEPVNRRGNGLVRCVQALSAAGFQEAAQRIDAIRHGAQWNEYAVQFVQRAQEVAEKKGVLDHLHILLYSSSLTQENVAALKTRPQGIIWL